MTNTQRGRRATGIARSGEGGGEGGNEAALVDAAEAFLAAQRLCSRTNVEASLGTAFAVSPTLLGYDVARSAREKALSRLRGLQARNLGGLAAKRVVFLTLVALSGFEDPRTSELGAELIEDYHAVLVTVWPEEKKAGGSLQAGWIDISEMDPESGTGA